MRTALIALTAALLSGCAASDADIARQEDRAAREQVRLNRALAGFVPGQSRTCLNAIDRRGARGAQYYGSTILYPLGSRIVRNDMNGNCPLRNDPILVTQTPTGDLCRGDIVQLIDRGSRFPVGSCAFGDFVTYERNRR
jgi:hypothetical protein